MSMPGVSTVPLEPPDGCAREKKTALEGRVPTVKCLVRKQPIASTYNALAELVTWSHPVPGMGIKQEIFCKKQIPAITGRNHGKGTQPPPPTPIHSDFELTYATFWWLFSER